MYYFIIKIKWSEQITNKLCKVIYQLSIHSCRIDFSIYLLSFFLLINKKLYKWAKYEFTAPCTSTAKTEEHFGRFWAKAAIICLGHYFNSCLIFVNWSININGFDLGGFHFTFGTRLGFPCVGCGTGQELGIVWRLRNSSSTDAAELTILVTKTCRCWKTRSFQNFHDCYLTIRGFFVYRQEVENKIVFVAYWCELYFLTIKILMWIKYKDH